MTPAAHSAVRAKTLLALLSLSATPAVSIANIGPELNAPISALTLNAGAAATPIALGNHLRDPDVPGSAVRISVRIGDVSSGIINVALLDAQTPLTVANFLAYVDAGRYENNLFHRSVPGFIIQNGGFSFSVANNQTYVNEVATFAPVLNEPVISNTRGTLAMAKLGGDPNSATSQWFINLADNSANLDAQNGGFTVFGRVLGSGMTVADSIASVPRWNASSYNSAWTDLPLTTGAFNRAYFVETSIARIAPLSHAVIADDPALVDAAVASGSLQITAKPAVAGSTTVRITTTDLEGATLQTAIPVTVLSSDSYTAWRQQKLNSVAASGSAAHDADPDADGLSNFLEYALGREPSVPDTATATTLSHDGQGRLALSFTRIADPAITYTVQVSADLAAWQTLAVAGNPSTGAANVAGPVTVTDTDPAGAARRFLRLLVAR